MGSRANYSIEVLEERKPVEIIENGEMGARTKLYISEWEYVGVAYPWHTFKARNVKSLQLLYVSAAVMYDSADNVEVIVQTFDRLLPSDSDYMISM